MEAALRLLGRRLPPGEAWVGRAADLDPDVGAPLMAAAVGSLACVPASVAGGQWALLSLATGDADREWSPVEVEALEIAARILGAAEESEQARAALHASEARYRAVVESASDLIQSIDREGRINFVNDAWASALGWSREEALELSVWEIVDPAERERWRGTLERVMSGESQSVLSSPAAASACGWKATSLLSSRAGVPWRRSPSSATSPSASGWPA
jgi:PAS domain S-box-containing protein